MDVNKDYISQLKQLVHIESVSSCDQQLDCENRQVIDLLANWLENIGFDCRIQPLTSDGGKANLIAHFSPPNRSLSGGLVFAGHTDTVPYNAHLWQQNPFELKLEQDRLYGLGATDMKGFFPSVIEALKVIFKQSKEIKNSIAIIATADEESTMKGARALKDGLFFKPDYAIIGEPTEMKPVRMHKGIMLQKITVHGKSGHSSNPSNGVNALEIMHTIITELMTWQDMLRQKYVNSSFEVKYPTLNLGRIHGGDNPNRICGNCEMEFDLRPLPQMNIEELLQQIRQIVITIAQERKVHIELSALAETVPPFEQDSNSTIVRLCERHSQHKSGAVAFATEAPFFSDLGMQTVIFGPGSIDQAHAPNEFIDYAQVDIAIEYYQKLITGLCYT